MDAKNIKARLRAISEQRKVLQTQSSMESIKNKSYTTLILGFCVFVLSLASIYAVFYKKKSLNISRPNMSLLEKDKPSLDTADVNVKIEELNKKIDAWTDKIWLLSLAHNENTNLNRQVQNRQGISDPGYICFDDKWKLSKKPTTMKLNDEQKKKLDDIQLK